MKTIITAIVVKIATIYNACEAFFSTRKGKPVAVGEEKESESNPKYDKSLEKLGTRDLCMELLKRSEFNFEINEDGGIVVPFDADFSLLINTSNESLFVKIWDWNWEDIDTDDIDEMSRCRQLINEFNGKKLSSNLFYVYDFNDNNRMYVRSCIKFLLMAEIPEIKSYFIDHIGTLLYSHKEFAQQLEQLRENSTNKQH